MSHNPNAPSGQDRIAARFPGISANGLRTYRDRHRRCTSAICPDEVETALQFLSMLTPTKTARVGSYTLKHVAEAWGRRHGLCGHVSNGALICAAVRLGLVLEARPWELASPNVGVGVLAKDVTRLQQIKITVRARS